jgi:uncharacterized membrane protein YdjX (TVP38/TMEM64 family)
MSRPCKRITSLIRPRLFAELIALAAIIIAARKLGLTNPAETLDRIRGLGPFGPLVFIMIYIAAAVALVPGSILTLAAGALFGLLWGTIYVSIAATAAATIAFLIGRYFARDWIAARLERYPKFSAVDRAVARGGWKIVGLTRLSPVFPYVFLNYAFGLTSVRLSEYVWASWLGMLPGTAMYVYIGSFGGQLARAYANTRGRSALEWALYALGLTATIALAVYASRLASRELRRQARESE